MSSSQPKSLKASIRSAFKRAAIALSFLSVTAAAGVAQAQSQDNASTSPQASSGIVTPSSTAMPYAAYTRAVAQAGTLLSEQTPANERLFRETALADLARETAVAPAAVTVIEPQPIAATQTQPLVAETAFHYDYPIAPRAAVIENLTQQLNVTPPAILERPAAPNETIVVTETTPERPLGETIQAAADEHPTDAAQSVLVADNTNPPVVTEEPAPSVEVAVNDFKGFFSERLLNSINDTAERTGVSRDYLAVKVFLESGGNCNARASTSSAAGCNQFIEQTWLAMFKKYGDDVGYGRLADHIQQARNGAYYVTGGHRRTILNMRFNTEVSQYLSAKYTLENIEHMVSRGIDNPNAYQAYEAHFAGAGGAVRIERAPSYVRAASVLPDAARANRSMFRNRTVASFRRAIADRIDDAARFLGIDVDRLSAPVYVAALPATTIAQADLPMQQQSQTLQAHLSPRVQLASTDPTALPAGPRPYTQVVAEGWGASAVMARNNTVAANTNASSTAATAFTIAANTAPVPTPRIAANANAAPSPAVQPALHSSVMDPAMAGRPVRPGTRAVSSLEARNSSIVGGNPALMRTYMR